MSNTDRPGWMDGNSRSRESVGSKGQPKSYIKSDLSSLPVSTRPSSSSGSSRSSSGIADAALFIIAWMLMLGLYFRVAYWLSLKVFDPDTIADISSVGRMVSSALAAIAFSTVTWMIVRDAFDG